MGSGARCPCLSSIFIGASTAPRRCLRRRWGGPGSSLRSLPAPIGQRSGVPSGLTGQTVTGARIWGGTAPPSHATVARPTRHRRPPSTPGPDRGSREGDGGDYAGGGAAWDKLRRRKMRMPVESGGWRENRAGNVHASPACVLRGISRSGMDPMVSATACGLLRHKMTTGGWYGSEINEVERLKAARRG